MHKATLVLACFACVGHGQQLDVPIGQSKGNRELAALLLGHDPMSAFQPSGSPVFNPTTFTASSPRRVENPVMADDYLVLKERVRGVTEVGKITRAMNLVAAAKVRKAQRNALASRPFTDYVEGSVGYLAKRLSLEDLDLPLLEQRPVKRVLLVPIGGDKGLCGPYNSRIIRKTLERMEELKADGLEVEIVAIGQRPGAFLQRQLIPLRRRELFGNNVNVSIASIVVDEAVTAFASGEADRVELIFTTFINMLTSEPTIRTMLPLSASSLGPQSDVKFSLSSRDGRPIIEKEETPAAATPKYSGYEIGSNVAWDNAPDDMLIGLLPLYMVGLVLKTLQESCASELASRMNAMKAATDNVKDIVKDLSRRMQAARRLKVTTDMLEVITGMNAVLEQEGVAE